VFGPTPGLFAGSEDCLYLNIYSPAVPAAAGRGVDRSALKPVMVWLHGGGFIEGSGAEYYPRALVEKEVVVVTLNYRLASLGFLTFGNSVVGGNMGLRDQLEALRWVQRYIHHFGGDPDKVLHQDLGVKCWI
jgi:carboxylesterase type B